MLPQLRPRQLRLWGSFYVRKFLSPAVTSCRAFFVIYFIFMLSFLSIRNQVCPNQSCDSLQNQEARKVLIHSQKERRLKCSRCQKTWVEHHKEKFFRLKVERQKIDWAQKLFDEGRSVREIAREIK